MRATLEMQAEHFAFEILGIPYTLWRWKMEKLMDREFQVHGQHVSSSYLGQVQSGWHMWDGACQQ